jgi:hypothetical protein
MWETSFRSNGPNNQNGFHPLAPDIPRYTRLAAAFLLFFLLLSTTAIPSHGREKDVLQYGEGLIVNIPEPEPEVAHVVEEVAQNTR